VNKEKESKTDAPELDIEVASSSHLTKAALIGEEVSD
jgi:hypothetical protein